MWKRIANLSPILLLACLALSACAKKQTKPAASSLQSASPNQASSLGQIVAVESFSQAKDVIAGGQLSCADTEKCPANVGMLLAADKAGGFIPDSNSVISCTAVLVAEDLVLTNSHCIPSAVKLLPELCSESVRFILVPANGAPSESIACRELVGASENETAMSPDLALIRLEKKTARKSQPIDRKGVSADSILTVYKVNPDLNNQSGVLEGQSCLSAPNSYRMPLYHSEADSIFVLGDCPTSLGNSGGPVLNSAGEAVGLLQAELPISPTALAAWLPHLEGGGEFAKLAMGTSLRCLTENLPLWSWNPDCKTISEQDVLQARPRLKNMPASSDLEPELRRALEPFYSQSSLFHWKRKKLSATPLKRTESLEPSCLSPPAAWMEEFQTDDALATEAEITLRLPELSLEARFNRFLQLQMPLIKLTGEVSRRYRIYPQRILHERNGNLVSLDESGEARELNFCELP